jgi:hypothetical protein
MEADRDVEMSDWETMEWVFRDVRKVSEKDSESDQLIGAQKLWTRMKHAIDETECNVNTVRTYLDYIIMSGKITLLQKERLFFRMMDHIEDPSVEMMNTFVNECMKHGFIENT